MDANAPKAPALITPDLLATTDRNHDRVLEDGIESVTE